MNVFKITALSAAVGMVVYLGCESAGRRAGQDSPPVSTERMPAANTPAGRQKVVKSEKQWRAQLTPEQYRIAREAGTERAFTGKYWNYKAKGVYQCVCCGQELFASDTKFDSGTGWPSFYAPTADGNLERRDDTSLGVVRSEVICTRCDAHLGHVFDDGPAPTGLRYCINSAALHFEKHNQTSE